MAKLTQRERKAHQNAMDILASDDKLTWHQIHHVLRDYHPGATNDQGVAGIFFTPPTLGQAFAKYIHPTSSRILDICAGIGTLGLSMLREYSYDITEMVFVEWNEEFLNIGKRLTRDIPEATWILGNAYDVDLLASLGKFDQFISNPPFGNIRDKRQTAWQEAKHPAHLAVIESAMRITSFAGGGLVIMPTQDLPQRYNGDRFFSIGRNIQRFMKAWPEVEITETHFDLSAWDGEWKNANPTVSMAVIDTRDSEKPLVLPGELNENDTPLLVFDPNRSSAFV